METNAKLDDYLDEAYPEVEIAGIKFSPSRILFELDPIAYACACADLGFDEWDEEEDEDDEDDEDEDL